MLNVVVINGGRGAGTLIPALLEREGINVTSVVNAYDDGKSTGEIRRYFGMLGPSDIRKVQELMLRPDDAAFQSNLRLFRFRFPEKVDHDQAISTLKWFVEGNSSLAGIEISDHLIKETLRIFLSEFLIGLAVIEKSMGEVFNFSDCSLMNCIYAGAFLKLERNFEQVTNSMDKLFRLSGTVLPTSIEDKKLVALRENGEMLYTEAEIVELRSNVRIERIYLLDNRPDPAKFERLSLEEKRHFLERHHCFVSVSEGVRLAVRLADIIVYSAGTQHSSLYPTYLSTGLAREIANNSKASKIFITNIGADYETPSYFASDYLLGAYRYLNLSERRNIALSELIHHNLVNESCRLSRDSYVVFDADSFRDIDVVVHQADYESEASPGKHDGHRLVEKILALHGSGQIAA